MVDIDTHEERNSCCLVMEAVKNSVEMNRIMVVGELSEEMGAWWDNAYFLYGTIPVILMPNRLHSGGFNAL